jgi:hypothetical protein
VGRVQIKTFYIRNCKWGEEKWPPDMLKITNLPAKNLDERISFPCAERRTMCGSLMNFGTAIKGKGAQVSYRIIDCQPKIRMNKLYFTWQQNMFIGESFNGIKGI